MTADTAAIVEATALDEASAGGLWAIFAFFFFLSMATPRVSKCAYTNNVEGCAHLQRPRS